MEEVNDNRVLKGGSWDSYPRFLQSANLVKMSFDLLNFRIGFRLVKKIKLNEEINK